MVKKVTSNKPIYLIPDEAAYAVIFEMTGLTKSQVGFKYETGYSSLKGTC
jgi:hypothetical protein